MKKRSLKGTVSIIMALALMLGLFAIPEINAKAEEENPTGLKEPVVEIKDVSEEEFSEIVEESQKADVETFVESCYKGTDAFWYQFSSPYYNYSFSRLNANQKKLYDALYNKLMPCIDGGADFDYDAGLGVYLTPAVQYTGLTQDEAINVAYLLMYDTPELYFLSQYVRINTVNYYGQMAVRIGVYDEMHTGAQRAYYASQIKSKINWYLSQVSTGASAYNKEKKIHDLLCDNCYYGDSATSFNQSCASVFLNPGGETVCAGYSEAFALLCYARGIPAMSITSTGHEWNQVKLGSYWYAVDVTWDDTGSSRYKYFDKSDNTMLMLSRSSHTIEYLWTVVGREKCPYDWGNEQPYSLSSSIYLYNHSYNNITAGLVVDNAQPYELDYMWMGYDINKNRWFVISDWAYGNEWCSWNPGKTGDFLLLGRARWHGTSGVDTEAHIGINHKQCIEAICQMPYQGYGGGYLIGMTTYDNPNNTYRYEVQILDCTLLANGYPYPWVYGTGKMNLNGGNTAWTIWQPTHGYYWTLYRIYDKKGNIIDEECYGFVA